MTAVLSGAPAQVPTWQELGYTGSGSRKAVIAPKGTTPAQIAYWEDIVRKTAQNEEFVALKSTMTELGLVKQSQ